MFNEELKNAWMKEYTDGRDVDASYVKTYMENIFNISEKTEAPLNKDLSSFTLPEIKTMFMSFASASVSTLRNRASILRMYTDFCIRNNYTMDGQNHYNDLMLDDYKDCINTVKAERMYLDYDDISEMLDTLSRNPRDQYLILAPWYGICGKGFREIIDLKLEDLDQKNNIASLSSGRKIEVPSELMDIMVESANTYTYISSEGKQRKLLNTTNVFKSFDVINMAEVSGAVLTRRMYKLKDMLDTPNLGYNMIRVSGFCYYLYKLTKSKEQTPMELHTSKDKDYVKLIETYDFTKKSITQINYMFDDYMDTMKNILK